MLKGKEKALKTTIARAQEVCVIASSYKSEGRFFLKIRCGNELRSRNDQKDGIVTTFFR